MIEFDVLENMTDDQISFIFDIARYYMRKSNSDSKTVSDVVDSMNEEQKSVLFYLICKAIEDSAIDDSKTMMLPLDADDVPIAVGDIVYDIRSGERLVIRGISNECALTSKRWYPGDRLTHKKPDSYEDIIKEAMSEGFEQVKRQYYIEDSYHKMSFKKAEIHDAVEKLVNRCEKVQERNKNL